MVKYVRCRASVNGVLLESANYATVTYVAGNLQFTEKTRALSGDAIYFEWNNLGADMQYFLNQWDGNANAWQVVAPRLSSTSYTLYGLDSNTAYYFALVALPSKNDGRNLKYETSGYITVNTLNDPYSFNVAQPRIEGTSAYIEWERVDRAAYTVELLQDGKDPQVMGDAETFDTGEFRQDGKFYVLTAARYHQMSWGTGSDAYNFFVKFLTDGITPANGSMPADANNDGLVTQNELFLYIKGREEDKENFVYQDVQAYPLNSNYILFAS